MSLLDIFVKTICSGVVPSERARTHDSEYVGHIGVQMIKTIVIAAQSTYKYYFRFHRLLSDKEMCANDTLFKHTV